MSIKKIHIIILFFACIIYGITAFNSIGYYHGDEHYQIIEFAGIKLGTHQASDLAWEYTAQSRQAIQPAICYIVFSILDFFHLTDPYWKAFFLRVLSMIYALFCISTFVRYSLHLVGVPYRILYIILSYFLWYIPVIAIRFSSETWGGLTFLLSIALLIQYRVKTKMSYIIIGTLFGFAFLFRYQMIIAIFGLLCWLIFLQKIKFNELTGIFLGGISICLLGILIDSWFYENFVVTAWTYFNKAIIEGMAAGFGTSPWHYYWFEIIKSQMVPIGIAFVFSIFVLLITKPQLSFLWIIIPFVICHSFISHKEIRFMFPLVFLVPIILVMAYEKIHSSQFLKNSKKPRLVLSGILGIFFAILNIAGLIVVANKSAGNTQMEIAYYIHKTYPNIPVQIYHIPWASPYTPWESVPCKFYQTENIADKKLNSLDDFKEITLNPAKVNLLVLRKIDLDMVNCDAPVLSGFTFTKLTQSLPKWLEHLDDWYQDQGKQRLFILYEIKENDHSAGHYHQDVYSNNRISIL